MLGIFELVGLNCERFDHVCELRVAHFLTHFRNVESSDKRVKPFLRRFCFLIAGPSLHQERKDAFPVDQPLFSVVQSIENGLS